MGMSLYVFNDFLSFLYIRYDEMQRVEFERTGGTSRSFDVKVTTIHDITYTFSSIGIPIYKYSVATLGAVLNLIQTANLPFIAF